MLWQKGSGAGLVLTFDEIGQLNRGILHLAGIANRINWDINFWDFWKDWYSSTILV
jgi:hypothetical protein